MNIQASKGRCNFCGNFFPKAKMVNHLNSCEKRKALLDRQGKTKFFHLLVEGSDLPEYWLHIEARGDTTLKKLDSFLRDIWLECCGHLSAFIIEERRYEVIKNEYLEGVKLMDVPLNRVLAPSLKFSHEYDFGSTTHLTLKVISERIGKFEGKPIQLLARNEPPLIKCEVCRKKATVVCTECLCEGRGWLCDGCASKHKCDEEMFLPVVNSPRVGTCGYTGELY